MSVLYCLKLERRCKMAETTWYETRMTSNTTPAPFVASASTEYTGMEAWKAFNGTVDSENDRWRSTTQTNSWITLDYGENKAVNMVRITAIGYSTVLGGTPIEFTVDGSNDNLNWNTLGSIVTTSFTIGESKEFKLDVLANFRYYRLTPTKSQSSTTYYNIGAITYGRYNINKILISSGDEVCSIKQNITKHETKMTSNTAPAPFVVSSSSSYTNAFLPWRAFNGINTSKDDVWMTSSNNSGEWIQIFYGSKRTVNHVDITSRNDNEPTSQVKDFNILGSNDGVNFEVLGEIRNQTNWKPNETRGFDIKQGDYSYYRLVILSNNIEVRTTIGQILYSHKKYEIIEAQSSSENSFVNYGMDKNTNINLESEIENVTYISDQSETLGSGKVFKVKIDTSKHPIKSVSIT